MRPPHHRYLSEEDQATWFEFLDDATQSMCTKIFCTTCGSGEFRMAAIDKAAQIIENAGLPFVGESIIGILMYRLPLASLGRRWRVREAIQVLFYTRIPIEDWERCLQAWLPDIHEDEDVTDWVLYRLVSCLPPHSPVRAQWVKACMKFAVEQRHSSILESLLIRFTDEAFAYEGLEARAEELRDSHWNLGRVLDNKRAVRV